MAKILTSYNPNLSGATALQFVGESGGAEGISEEAKRYVRNSLAANTLKSYSSDLRHFLSWGGSLPATDIMLANYLADLAQTFAVSTLERRVAALSRVHRAKGLPNPATSPLVKAVIRGVKREKTVKQRQAKPLLKQDLVRLIDTLGNDIRDVRDQALLTVGFWGGFRCSEICAINCTASILRENRLVIELSRSKTDQTGIGRTVLLTSRNDEICPVRGLSRWLRRSGITKGDIFRSVDRWGNLGQKAISSDHVARILIKRIAAAGMDVIGYSGHSLRAGYVTSQAKQGVPDWQIRAITGHKSSQSFENYIRTKPQHPDRPEYITNGS